ncbi:T-complex protein 1 subunit zeta 2 [Porphyridium purpureum]|uniref:T-complex protein 1 subunit zeta 2 n=1 Tax=Porphyridium purpureum TaxID=35688 RepID=A0A5J4Z5Z8_PORPP|nr:T-complex protein 1 subunit zeta 2 [Porphyridium purpureum]|eukprot:POR8797..scf295_1
MAAQLLNPGAEVSRRGLALYTTISAAKGLQEVLRSNLGPKGTMKMLVSGAGDIKLTKDGNVLLNEMQIKNPTASLIARTATAQDDMVGDGTTSTVLLIGELLKQSERYLVEGLHPRVLADGFDIAREVLNGWIDSQKVSKKVDRELLVAVSRVALQTKLVEHLANQLAEMVADAVLLVKGENSSAAIDLHMVEIMTMEHQTDGDSRLVRGLVLDHGGRHPDMPKQLKNCYILTCNVSLEHEKSDVNSGFFYRDAEQRERMVAAEREVVNEKVRKIIALKKKVCDGTDKHFVVVNQKGIDPQSLDMLAREGILGLRRAKRRNMERLALACGGNAVNSVEELTESDLGYAGNVFEQTLGEDKFTFIEDVENPYSCTLLLKGPNKHTIMQLKDAVRDGLRAVKLTIEDNCVLPGGGCFEVAASRHLRALADGGNIPGKTKLGIYAFADALLIIPKTLAENAGHDAQDCVMRLQDEQAAGKMVGLDVNTGEPMDPVATGVFDGYLVKKQMLSLSSIIAEQLLLVDEILRAGRDVSSGKK